MTTKFKKLFENKKSASYYFKITVTYSLLLAISLVAFSSFIMVVFLYQSEKLITDSNSQMLNQLNNFTDKYLLERINSLCAEYFSEDSSYPEINSFSKDIQHTSNEEIYSINKTLKTIVSQNDFLHSLILYNGKYDSMISTIDGVVHDAKNPRNQLTIDNTIFSYLSEVSNDFWIPQDDNMAFIDQKNILTFVHYISINDATAFGKKDVTYVLISIDIEDISNFIGNVNGSGVENFLMMDKNNKILTHSENFPDYDKFSEKNPKVFEKIAKSREGQVREKFDNNASLVVWTQSHVNDWKYVYTLSLAPLYRQMLFVIIAIVLITIVILLLGFYFIKRYTKRIYKPFELVIERVKDNIDSDLYSDNEFEMLNSMLSNFNLTKNTISTITEKYNTVIVDKIANDIINGFVSDDNSDLLEQLRLSGATFDKSKFTLLVLELNPLLLTSFPIKQREYVVFNIIDILYNNFNCVPVRTTSSTIEAILNYDDIDIHSVAKTIKDLIPHKSFTNIYCSAFVNSLDKISELHKEAKDVLKYSYVYGFDNIFDVSTLSKMDLDASVVTEKQFTRLENTLTNGDKQEFYHECNKILNAVKTEEHSFNYAQNVIMQIFSVICRVAREQNVPLKDNSAFDKILKNISFDNSAICLFDISDSFFNKLGNKDDNHQQKLASEIIEYISNNITKDLSLVSVSEHFNISSGYLSKFFKENTDSSFSKYVIAKKFEYAAKEIIENPKTPIAEIANNLGYFDVAYFARQFKINYGTTPIQYRKSHTS